MNQSQIIGTKIKKQRLYHKMTLKQLSDATGLSIGYLSQVERGLGTLSLPALENLSNILHIEMSSFFEQEKEENSDLIVQPSERKTSGFQSVSALFSKPSVLRNSACYL